MEVGRANARPRRGRRSGDPTEARLAALRLHVHRLESEKLVLAREVEQHRRAEELARGQAQMLIESQGFLAAEPDMDSFLGHVLKVTVQQLEGVGGTLWFPDRETDTVRLHLEYVESRTVRAHESCHPAVLCPLPIGGRGVSTFPTDHPEMYLMREAVAGMPEVNRAYINSLGVRILLTVPMVLGTETVGWICVRSSHGDAREIESKIALAEALAGQATLAVHMARLGAQARHAAILQERNRIARDIHDTLAQGFTGVVVNLEAASRALRKAAPASALDHIDHARMLAQSCLDEARQSVRSLRPDASNRADLGQALGAQARRVEASGARGEFHTRGEKLPLPVEVESELLRIAQECITNVLKHAHAGRVEVWLDYGADSLSLTVMDDGIGFDPARPHDGFGMLGMRERAARIGASVNVASRPGQGSSVTTRLPIGPSVGGH